jgi:AhpC/TSA family/Disulphide bond corrector protein DsbC
LQSATEKFKAQGVGVVAISYDNEAILRDFAKRHGITYPLLADPHSELIRQYGVLDERATGFTKGMAHPGYFYVTPDGRIKEAFFETAYTDRFTANNLLLKLFPELEEGGRSVPAPHVGLTLSQSDQAVVAGSRITIGLDVTLPEGVHVYAPGVTGYKPISLQLEPAGELRPLQAVYPDAKSLFLPAIGETVPVFEGRFRITQDLVVASKATFIKSVGKGQKLTVAGSLRYQACDETKCFLPAEIPVSWEIQVAPLDLKRAPAAAQHK